MSINWDIYNKRLNTDGSTERERQVCGLRNNILNHSQHNPSYKDIFLNGEPSQLVINTGTQPYYKEFESLPGQIINIGDYVDFANKKWLVTTADADDELYVDGKLEQCNWLLKWQNEKGEIIERWAVIMSASKYNDGINSSPTMVLGSDQLSVIIPVDSESLKLKKSMNKKFFIDNDPEHPTAYELTGTGNVSDTYNGHGVTSWIVNECAYSPTADDLKYGVCNYASPTTPTEPTIPDSGDENLDKEMNYTASIVGSSEIKCGGNYKTYTGKFFNENGNEISDIGLWTVESEIPNDCIVMTKSDNFLKLKISDNDEMIGKTIHLIFSNQDNSISASIGIYIVGY